MSEIVFELHPDAPPFALGVSAVLKRSAARASLAKRLRRMKGVLGVRSSSDPQTATVRFDRGRIGIAGGLAEDADVLITIDPNDADAKPKVKGAGRHLLFALDLAKVMEPPTGTWQEEAAAFWAFASPAPRMPSRLRVVCTDDVTEAIFGDGDDSTYEIHGTAKALTSVFSGASILGQDALEGKLLIVGRIEHVSIITGRSIAWALGEGR
jgi:hypothetical protein